MRKLVAYEMTVTEAEEKLQKWLKDPTLHLVENPHGYFDVACKKFPEAEGTAAWVDFKFSEIFDYYTGKWFDFENHVTCGRPGSEELGFLLVVKARRLFL